MIFISVLIALVIEKRITEVVRFRRFDWFVQLNQLANDKFSEQEWWQTWLPPLTIILVIPCIYWLIFSGDSGLFGSLIQLVLSVLVLIYCLGPQSIDSWLKPYFEALDNGDYQAAKYLMNDSLPAQDIDNEQQLGRLVTQQIFVEAHQRYFAVIFWFIICGPIGALIYRLTCIYALTLANNQSHVACTSRLLSILNWAPARLTGFSFALAGDFVSAHHHIKRFITEYSCHTYAILSGAGLGANQCKDEPDGPPQQENKQAIDLSERAMVIWVVALALMTIFGVL
jgi:AmpE protein